MASLHPKKSLGQHFLRDANTARRMVKALLESTAASQQGALTVLEVGAGTGFLTRYLLEAGVLPYAVEVDPRAAAILKREFPALKGRIIAADFLKMDLGELPGAPFAVAGNFPYNLSSQILFKVLQNKERIPMVLGMFQREVAERIVSPPGSKKYGILSVLLGAFYRREYLFTVSEKVFHPRPRVKSAVVRLTRTESPEGLNGARAQERFIRLVKKAFAHRRKTLRNALEISPPPPPQDAILRKRAEELSVEDFIRLMLFWEKS